MPYQIVNIGSSFNDKAIDALTSRLNSAEGQGWTFHSVFMIEHRTCLGLSKANAYLAVFHRP